MTSKVIFSKSKCDFCIYMVGNECTAAKANGQVNSYYCRQAIYEYNEWQKQQSKQSKKFEKDKYRYWRWR